MDSEQEQMIAGLRHAPRILIVTDISTDGELIKELICAEFDEVYISIRPTKFIEDFEEIKPTTLMLAFKSIQKAKEYYEGLFRDSLKVHSIPHRTLLLCSKDEVPDAYAECTRRNFDDYVLFWPMAQDGYRLRMAVHHAIHYMSTSEGVSASELAIQARRIRSLEQMLDESMEKGDMHITSAQNSAKAMEEKADSSAQKVAGKMYERMDTVDGAAQMKAVLKELLLEELRPKATTMREKIQPIKKWSDDLKRDIDLHRPLMQTLQDLAGEVKPAILAFEDEPFHQKMIARVLEGCNLDVFFVKTAAAGLLAMRTFRPDLILMDIGLPDVSGIDTIAQIKSIKRFASIPVIVLTGHSEKERVIKAIKAGAAEFVVKPFEPEGFREKIMHFVALD